MMVPFPSFWQTLPQIFNAEFPVVSRTVPPVPAAPTAAAETAAAVLRARSAAATAFAPRLTAALPIPRRNAPTATCTGMIPAETKEAMLDPAVIHVL